MRNISTIMAVASLALCPLGVAANPSSSHKTHTLTGCLSGPNRDGSYTLKSGAKQVEVEGSADLKDNVGHKVKVSGLWMQSPQTSDKDVETQGRTSTTATTASSGKAESRERHFEANRVQLVSDTCSRGASAKSSMSDAGSSSGSSR